MIARVLGWSAANFANWRSVAELRCAQNEGLDFLNFLAKGLLLLVMY